MILRTTFENGYQTNHDLGSEYHLISKEQCPVKFEECSKLHFGENLENFKEGTYAFISYNQGADDIPLYKGFRYYILNNEGGLFANLTFK